MFYPTTCVGLRYGPSADMLSGFSWEHGYHRCRIVPGDAPFCRASPQPGDLPPARIALRFNALFRQCAGVSLLRRHLALPPGNGIFTVCPSAAPCGCALGPDLP